MKNINTTFFEMIILLSFENLLFRETKPSEWTVIHLQRLRSTKVLESLWGHVTMFR